MFWYKIGPTVDHDTLRPWHGGGKGQTSCRASSMPEQKFSQSKELKRSVKTQNSNPNLLLLLVFLGGGSLCGAQGRWNVFADIMNFTRQQSWWLYGGFQIWSPEIINKTEEGKSNSTSLPCINTKSSPCHNHEPWPHVGEGHIHPTLCHLEDVATYTNTLPLRQDCIFPRLPQIPLFPPHGIQP